MLNIKDIASKDLIYLINEYIFLQLKYLEEVEKTYKPQNINDTLDSNVITFYGRNEDYFSKIEQYENLFEKLQTATKNGEISLPFFTVCKTFRLTPLEIHFLMVALSSAVDEKISALCSELNISSNHLNPTIGLAIRLFRTKEVLKFNEEILSSLENKLFTFFFKKENSPLCLSSQLVFEDIFFMFLINGKYEFPQECCILNHEENDFDIFYPCNKTVDKIVSTAEENKTLICFYGENGSGRKSMASSCAKYLDKNIICIDWLLFYKANQKDFNTTFTKLICGILCSNAILCMVMPRLEELEKEFYIFTNFSFKKYFFYENTLFLTAYEENIELTCNHSQNIFLPLNLPAYAQRLDLWKHMSKAINIEENLLLEIASKFNFTAGQIKNAILQCTLISKGDLITKDMLNTACYNQCISQLDKLAEKIKPDFSWEQLVLPENVINEMKNACNHVAYRAMVMEQWGFNKRISYGNGVHMLFTGPPGTGKTMAARVIAKELSMDIYKVDTSRLVSKYVGETEKNFDKVFEAGKKSNVILFFDEMDALFGKRSETTSTNDKYANLEISYLLQKIEDYNGVVVMSTNYLQNVDEAFMRRIHFVFHFPFPSPTYREKLWKSMIPIEANSKNDIDFLFIANNFEFAGGIIKNCVISAAFLAAAQNSNISMKHIINAIFDEMTKQRKTILKSDFGEYSFYIETRN